MRRGPFLVALFLAALTLRAQLVGIGPLLPLIKTDLGVSHAVAGLLGTIPVLCMGAVRAAGRLPGGADRRAERGRRDGADHRRLRRCSARSRPARRR